MQHTANLRGYVNMESHAALTRRAEFSGKRWAFITRTSVETPTIVFINIWKCFSLECSLLNLQSLLFLRFRKIRLHNIEK